MEEQSISAKVSRTRHYRGFAELAKATRVLLENANEQNPGWFYECMTAILLSAFKLEAYLNHVGEKIFPTDWKDLERRSFKQKLNCIRQKLSLQNTDDVRPYLTLVDLFQFRNTIAHSRDEHLEQLDVVEVGTPEELRRRHPLTAWEELCTLEFANRAYLDTQEIVEHLHLAAGLDPSTLSRGGSGYSITYEN